MHGLTSRQLEAQSRKAGEIIGFKQMYFWNYPDNRFDTIPLLDICKTIELYLEEIKPDILFVHHSDLNIDHCIARRACLTAARPGCSSVRKIYAFEIPSSTEWSEETFKPNVFKEITQADLDTKIKAFQCYTTEIRQYPHPRSAEGLRAHAEWYGMMCGCEHAEAFELIRSIR
jgi:LmbE family N-acetylglucosaminyl deacetylase